MSLHEIYQWQESYCVYAADDIYIGQKGKELLKKITLWEI